MFRTIARLFLPNPLDRMLKKLSKKGGTKILLGWNRGLGDIALGLYAIIHRIREFIPDAEITFLVRPNLAEGFTLLDNIHLLPAPDWKRGEPYSVPKTLAQLGIDKSRFDLIIERPNPTDWVRWQKGKLIPQLVWNPAHDDLWESFDLPKEGFYICAQPVAETNYGLWRNWPLERWHELFQRLEKIPDAKVLLFGYETDPIFSYSNVIDLRGKTTLFQLLSIVKNRVKAAILPDSGILSMIYYLAASFPIQVISLWADPNHGILKQGVFSPNPKLVHTPCIGQNRDLSNVSAEEVIHKIFPAIPLMECPNAADIDPGPIERVGVILLAGGQGSRLGISGPKGLFEIQKKSLFEWVCEKVPIHIPLAVMTSPLNHAETVSFFQKNDFFGRKIHFFQQELLPMLDDEKQPIGILAPDGNGSVFKSFQQSGLADQFEAEGIDLISIVPIENLLANPTDPIFISYMRQTGADAGVKCIEKMPEDAPMGALVKRAGKLEIVEYTETNPSEQYKYCYTGMMAMKLSFMKQMANLELPLHWVWKKADKRFAWKGERFIFDVLPFADRVGALCYPKKKIYAPIKNETNLNEVLQSISHQS